MNNLQWISWIIHKKCISVAKVCNAFLQSIANILSQENIVNFYYNKF